MSFRSWLALVVGSIAITVGAGACGSDDSTPASGTAEEHEDIAASFDGFEPAEESNGDLSNVVWPDFVTDASPEVQRLYEFQVTHGDVMRYMPCFCGCGQNAGHRSNRDCFIQAVNADGSVEFDRMAPNCGVCLDVARQTMEGLEQGESPRDIRAAIDQQYADSIDASTPTPYPPA